MLSETLCTKYRVTEKHTFATSSTVIAGLDPAFGGDRCVLRFAKYGDLSSGLMGLDFEDIVSINVDSSSDEPIHFQIARQVKEECVSRGARQNTLPLMPLVRAEGFAISCTKSGAT